MLFVAGLSNVRNRFWVHIRCWFDILKLKALNREPLCIYSSINISKCFVWLLKKISQIKKTKNILLCAYRPLSAVMLSSEAASQVGGKICIIFFMGIIRTLSEHRS